MLIFEEICNAARVCVCVCVPTVALRGKKQFIRIISLVTKCLEADGFS